VNFGARFWRSSLGTVVDIGAVVDVENVHGAGALIYPIHDAVGSATSTMAASERAEKRLAYPVWVLGECGIAKLQHGCGNRLR
jgi:hypothetical protein